MGPSPSINIVSSSSPTGTQYLQAVGCAEAGRHLDPESDEITLVSSGEGATSEGEFWESMNAACLNRLPVLFLIEDNGYAISVPVECQTAGGNISKLVEGFPWLVPPGSGRHRFPGVVPRHAGGGRDIAARGTVRRWCTRTCTRPYSHSLSDDERLYKTAAEREGGGRARSGADVSRDT